MSDITSLLAERGLFAFDGGAHEEISHFFEEGGRQPGYEILLHLAFLTAAEFALTPILSYPRAVLPAREPISVDAAAARLALAKANCIVIEYCGERVQAGSLTLPDVSAFGGDIAKLEAVGLSSAEPPTEIGDAARAVDALEHAHRQAPTKFAQELGESGVLRLQGFLWAIKLSLPHRDVAQAVADSYDAFELSRPVGGLQVPATV